MAAFLRPKISPLEMKGGKRFRMIGIEKTGVCFLRHFLAKYDKKRYTIQCVVS